MKKSILFCLLVMAMAMIGRQPAHAQWAVGTDQVPAQYRWDANSLPATDDGHAATLIDGGHFSINFSMYGCGPSYMLKNPIATIRFAREIPANSYMVYYTMDNQTQALNFGVTGSDSVFVYMDQSTLAQSSVYTVVAKYGRQIRLNQDCYTMFANLNIKEVDFGDVIFDDVTNMDRMFTYCKYIKSLTLPKGFRNAHPTSAFAMFRGCESITSLDVTNLYTANLTNIAEMFQGCEQLTNLALPEVLISSSVTRADSLFYKSYNLTSLDLSTSDVSNVETMNGMFKSCKKLKTLNLSGWNTAKVKDMRRMFEDCYALTTIFADEVRTADGKTTGFAIPTEIIGSQSPTDRIFMSCTSVVGGKGTTYQFYNGGSYAHVDGGTANPGYFTMLGRIEPENVRAAIPNGATSIVFVSGALPEDASQSGTDKGTFKVYSSTSTSGKYYIAPSAEGTALAMGNDAKGMFKNCSTLVSIDLSGVNMSAVTDMSEMFAGCSALTSIDLKMIQSHQLVNTKAMFSGCSSLTTILVDNVYSQDGATVVMGFDPESVTASDDMFSGCTSLVGGNSTTYNAAHTNKDYACVDRNGHPGYFTQYVEGGQVTGPNNTYPTAMSYSETGKPEYQYTRNAETGIEYTLRFKVAIFNNAGDNAAWYDPSLSIDGNPCLFNNGATSNLNTIFPIFNTLNEQTPVLHAKDGYIDGSITAPSHADFTTSAGLRGWVDLSTELQFGCNAEGYAATNDANYTYLVVEMHLSDSAAHRIQWAGSWHNGSAGATQTNYKFDIDMYGLPYAKTLLVGRAPEGVQILPWEYAVPTFPETGENEQIAATYSDYPNGYWMIFRQFLKIEDNSLSELVCLSQDANPAETYQDTLHCKPGYKAIYSLVFTGRRPDIQNTTDPAKNGIVVSATTEALEHASEGTASPNNDASYTHCGTKAERCRYCGKLMTTPEEDCEGQPKWDYPNIENLPYSVTVDSEDETGRTLIFTSKDNKVYIWTITEAGGASQQLYGMTVNYTGTGSVTQVVLEERTDVAMLDGQGIYSLLLQLDKMGTNYTVSFVKSAPAGSTDITNTRIGTNRTIRQHYITNTDVSVYQKGSDYYIVSPKTILMNPCHWVFSGLNYLTAIDFSNFSTENVTDMKGMFSQCSGLTTIRVGNGFTTKNVVKSSYMFEDCTKLVGGNGTTYNSANPDDMTYARVDGGSAAPGYFTLNSVALDADMFRTIANYYAVGYNANYSIAKTCTSISVIDHKDLPDDATVASYTGGPTGKLNADSTIALYRDATTTTKYYVAPTMDDMPIMATTLYSTDGQGLFHGFNKATDIHLDNLATYGCTNMTRLFSTCKLLTTINFGPHFNTASVEKMDSMFYFCDALTSLDLRCFNTEKVTSMYSMFRWCHNLASINLSSFNTRKVTNLSKMFDSCQELSTIDLSGIKTAYVTNMSCMFSGCSGLTSLDIKGFNTANVKDMSSLFDGCSSLESLNLSNFNTSSVTDMSFLFSGTTFTSIDLSKFNTSSVENMSYLFSGCEYLTSIDLSKFDTKNVTDMSYMFDGCTGLSSLDLSTLNTANVEHMEGMFNGCTGLESLDLTKFNTGNVSNMNYMFNGCSGLTSLTFDNFDMRSVDEYSGMFTDINAENATLTLKSLPYLASAAFATDWMSVVYDLSDKSTVVLGCSNYPDPTQEPTYTRAMSYSWGTAVLPFQVNAAKNNEVTLYKLTGVDSQLGDAAAGTLTFTPLAAGDSIEANTPFVFKKNDAAATSVTFVGEMYKYYSYEEWEWDYDKDDYVRDEDGNPVETVVSGRYASAPNADYPSEVTIEGTDFTMYGTYATEYETTSIVSDEDYTMYFIARDGFWRADTETTVNKFRGWFQMSAGSEAPARFMIEEAQTPGVATGFDHLTNDEVKAIKLLIDGQLYILRDNRMYDMNGRMVK